MIEPSSSSLWGVMVSTVVEIQAEGVGVEGDGQHRRIVMICVLGYVVICGGRHAWPAIGE